MQKPNVDYKALISKALTDSGTLNKCFNLFYKYSPLNTLQLMWQGVAEPVATYKRWEEMGRHVKAGSKAKSILVPIMVKDKDKTDKDGNAIYSKMFFKDSKCLFVLSDTDGAEYTSELHKFDYNKERLLSNLAITQIPFTILDGNTQGYAITKKQQVAISPICKDYDRTLFHELAHCILHNGVDETIEMHGSELPKCIKEFEAEMTSYIVSNAVGIATDQSNTYSSGYLQNWLRGKEVDNKHIKRVLSATNKIIKAL